MAATMTAAAQAAAPKIHRGLAGIYIDRSQVCMIDGKEGVLGLERLPRSASPWALR